MIVVRKLCLRLLSGGNIHDYAQINRLSIVIINPRTINVRPADLATFRHNPVLHRQRSPVLDCLPDKARHHIQILRINKLRGIIMKLHAVLRSAVSRQSEETIIRIKDLKIIQTNLDHTTRNTVCDKIQLSFGIVDILQMPLRTRNIQT